MTKTTLTMVRLPKYIIRQHNLNSISKSGLLDEAGIQVEFPRTLRRGYCGGAMCLARCVWGCRVLAKLECIRELAARARSMGSRPGTLGIGACLLLSAFGSRSLFIQWRRLA